MTAYVCNIISQYKLKHQKIRRHRSTFNNLSKLITVVAKEANVGKHTAILNTTKIQPNRDMSTNDHDVYTSDQDMIISYYEVVTSDHKEVTNVF